MDPGFTAVQKGATVHARAHRPIGLQAIMGDYTTEFDFLLRIGAVYVNCRRISEPTVLAAGDYLRCHLNPKRFNVQGIDWKSLIGSASEDFLIVDKPPGLPVHATLDNRLENLVTQLSLQQNETLLVTHRIDQPTQGLVVLARNPKAVAQFHRWLKRYQVHKKYRALVSRPITPATYVHFMKPSAHGPKEMADAASPGDLRCEMVIHQCRPVRDGYSLEIELITGRTHQIRAQLKFLHAPLLGDDLYGGPAYPVLGLQSFAIAFPISMPQYGYVIKNAPWPELNSMSEKPTDTDTKDADFYYDESGLLVFTEAYHLRRGKCCESGCRHCPYGFLKESPKSEAKR